MNRSHNCKRFCTLSEVRFTDICNLAKTVISLSLVVSRKKPGLRSRFSMVLDVCGVGMCRLPLYKIELSTSYLSFF